MSMDKHSLVGLLPQDMSSFIESVGEPLYRARQVTEWIYRKKVPSFDHMSTLPQSLRDALKKNFFLAQGKIVHTLTSHDGTVKYLVAFPDGQAVEAVSIPQGKRLTLCVSSQVGCAVGCPYCATGKAGFTRDLESQEIVEEVWMAQKANDQRIGNLVFMGMGEPLLNYTNLSRAILVLNHPQGMGIGTRHITVSTTGVPSKMVQLARDWEQVNLAVSLHAPDNDLRTELVPVSRAWPLREVMEAVDEVIGLTNRRMTVEYTLWNGINDLVSHAHALAALCRGRLLHVNLIPGNPGGGKRFRPSSLPRVLTFQGILREKGIPVTIRKERGRDIQAACGELYRTWTQAE